MKRITVQQLRDAGACREQVAIFAAEWPDGAEVSVENVLRAMALDLDVFWLRNLLTSAANRAYAEAVAPANRAYADAAATASRAYVEAVAPTRRAYYEACATERRAYDEAVAPASRAYADAAATASRAYAEAVAPALVAALLASGEPR